MKNTYKNLWHDTLNVRKSPFYTNEAPCVLDYRGFQVFELFSTGFDYVFNGACITQRAGFNKVKGKTIIDAIIAGEEVVSNQSADHLRANGIKCAIGYKEMPQ